MVLVCPGIQRMELLNLWASRNGTPSLALPAEMTAFKQRSFVMIKKKARCIA